MMMQLLHFVKCSQGEQLATKTNRHLCMLRPTLGQTMAVPL
jgi:hypothetical protein